MKLYRINKLVGDRIVKKRDVLAGTDKQAIRTAEESPDCPVCDVWAEGKKVGSIT